jgi:hypothetical protein
MDEVTVKWRRLRNEELHDLFLTKYYSGDQTKKNEMGRECGTYRRQERCIQGFGGLTSEKESTWEVWEQTRG